MKPSISVGIILIVGMVLVISGKAAPETLIGRINDWPPLYFKENGKWTGISVDAYEALAAEADVPLELKEIPWSRALAEMKSKPIMLANLTPTQERRKIMHFIGPHHNEIMSLTVASRYVNEKISSLDDLLSLIQRTGQKVGYQRDVFISDEFNRRLEGDLFFRSNFHIYSNYESITKMVANGRLLGYIGIYESSAYRLKYELGENPPIAVHPFVLSETRVYIGVSKTVSSETLKKLADANERLTHNGTWDRLMRKWSFKP